jgi:hypothetical protein
MKLAATAQAREKMRPLSNANVVKHLCLPGVLILLLLISACAPAESPQKTLHVQAEAAVPQTNTATAAATITPSPTLVPTATLTPTRTQTLTDTPTATITPTYAVLRGQVLQLSNCRYGPGAPYLYKYALIEGSNLDIIGRNERGTWVLVQAIGGNNPCWVKATLMDIQGEVLSVEPTYPPLPMSPYYGPLTHYSAVREGDEVTILWRGIQLRAGDDSGQYPYLVEAWLCQAGELIFTPIGSYETAVKVVDEAGCREPSHARLYAVEKHGYTRWVEISWPPHE